ncbi:MAG: transcriptional regulator [Fimbriimonadaceae bacterium]
MTTFQKITRIDRLIHEPARLSLLSALRFEDQPTTFRALLELTSLTEGNLFCHLSRLEKAGLVTTKKTMDSQGSFTAVSLTPSGEAAIDQYWEEIKDLRRELRNGTDKAEDKSRKPAKKSKKK